MNAPAEGLVRMNYNIPIMKSVLLLIRWCIYTSGELTVYMHTCWYGNMICWEQMPMLLELHFHDSCSNMTLKYHLQSQLWVVTTTLYEWEPIIYSQANWGLRNTANTLSELCDKDASMQRTSNGERVLRKYYCHDSEETPPDLRCLGDSEVDC